MSQAVYPLATYARNLRRWLREAGPSEWRVGLDWYANASQDIHRLGAKYGIPHGQLCGVVAVLSPMMRWERNLVEAENVITGRRSAAYGPNVRKAAYILAGEDPEEIVSGPKVTAFYRLLLSGRRGSLPRVRRQHCRAGCNRYRSESAGDQRGRGARFQPAGAAKDHPSRVPPGRINLQPSAVSGTGHRVDHVEKREGSSMTVDFEQERARRRYRVHLRLILVQAAHIAVMGAASAEEAIEIARASVETDAVMTEGTATTIGYEITGTVLERT
jgi:hypothetical protein